MSDNPADDDYELKPINLGGRPRVELDMEQLEAMAQIGCTAEEISTVLKCSPDTITRRLQEAGWAGFADFRNHHLTPVKMSVRRKQIALALKGNTTMLVWVGKTLCDQSETTNVKATVTPGADADAAARIDAALENADPDELEVLERVFARIGDDASGDLSAEG